MNTKKRLTVVIGFIYFSTLIFHIALQINGGQSTEANSQLLGVAMVLPLVAALLVQKVFFTEAVFHTLGISFKFNRWWFVAILLPIFMALFVKLLLFETSTLMSAQKFLALLVIGLTIASVSALFEEVVWRGYLFHYTKGFGYFNSMFFTAIVWSMWHLPVAWFYKYTTAPLAGTSLFLTHLFLLSILISLIRVKSHSVIPAAIAHGMLNVFYLNGNHGLLVEGAQLAVTIVFVGALLVMTRKRNESSYS